GSKVSLLTRAMRLRNKPSTSAGSTKSTRVKVAQVPRGRVGGEQMMLPVAPTAGVEQTNDGPPVWLSETNGVPAGTLKFSRTFWASLGPKSATLIVKFTWVPGGTVVSGVVTFTPRLACVMTPTVSAAELLAAVGSGVGLVTWATFESEEPLG